jgi:hypothetical protein
LVKYKKYKVDRKALFLFSFKEESVHDAEEGTQGLISVTMKSSESRKEANQVSDYEVLLEILGIDIFKKLG